MFSREIFDKVFAEPGDAQPVPPPEHEEGTMMDTSNHEIREAMRAAAEAVMMVVDLTHDNGDLITAQDVLAALPEFTAGLPTTRAQRGRARDHPQTHVHAVGRNTTAPTNANAAHIATAAAIWGITALLQWTRRRGDSARPKGASAANSLAPDTGPF